MKGVDLISKESINFEKISIIVKKREKFYF